MKRKMSWRSLKFIPTGGDEAQAITRKDKGFMHLCELYRYHPQQFSGFGVFDTAGMFAKYGPNNVVVSWADFRLALTKHTMKSPPEKPSVFCGEHFPPEHSIRLRKRLLAAALREYISPRQLAEDILEWLSPGKEDDIREFAVSILHGVGWHKEPPRTVAEASAKSAEPSKDEIPKIE